MDSSSLTREDWLDLALAELRDRGYSALKAQPLAKKLNVTRGSFYYHFESVDDFHAAVIAHWSERSSGRIIKRAQDTGDPRTALNELLQKTFHSGEELERAIRSWSTVQSAVAEAVEQVDRDRIKVAEKLLVEGGVHRPAAAARAKLLYWAAIGRLMLPFPKNSVLSQTQISDLTALMLQD